LIVRGAKVANILAVKGKAGKYPGSKGRKGGKYPGNKREWWQIFQQ
jgi:hypothetical protein